MDEPVYNPLANICAQCGGRCCYYARPPLSEERISILIRNGVSIDKVQFGKYRCLSTKPTGFCVEYHNGKCMVQGIKPETCIAGPFTFDIKDGKLQIFLKKERICNLVTFLKGNHEAFKEQYDLALGSIIRLIKSLPDEELREVLKVEEPETEKVSEIPLAEVQCEYTGN